MVKEIKSESFAVNWGKVWIDFVDGVENFYNVDLKRFWRLG
jgi:hypothetical protein